jgi:hypothetical protein
VILMVGVFFTAWPGLLFPIWILALSISVLVELRRDGTAMNMTRSA